MPISQKLFRWMSFVDGENFTFRAQDVAKERDIQVVENWYFKKDCFIWMPNKPAWQPWFGQSAEQMREQRATRNYYYTSTSQSQIEPVREMLWALGFEPRVFQRPKTRGSKGVDIALARDMLAHGFRDHYDIAFLIAGDGDYLPLVEEVKHVGKIVYLAFFEDHGLSRELRLSADRYIDLTEDFCNSWRHGANTPPHPR